MKKLLTKRRLTRVLSHVLIQLIIWLQIFRFESSLSNIFTISLGEEHLATQYFVPIIVFVIVELLFRSSNDTSDNTFPNASKIEQQLSEQKGQSFIYQGIGTKRDMYALLIIILLGIMIVLTV